MQARRAIDTRAPTRCLHIHRVELLLGWYQRQIGSYGEHSRRIMRSLWVEMRLVTTLSSQVCPCYWEVDPVWPRVGLGKLNACHKSSDDIVRKIHNSTKTYQLLGFSPLKVKSVSDNTFGSETTIHFLSTLSSGYYYVPYTSSLRYGLDSLCCPSPQCRHSSTQKGMWEICRWFGVRRYVFSGTSGFSVIYKMVSHNSAETWQRTPR